MKRSDILIALTDFDFWLDVLAALALSGSLGFIAELLHRLAQAYR